MLTLHPKTLTILFTLASASCSTSTDSSNPDSSAEKWVKQFEQKMQKEASNNNIPGMAIALVKGDQTILAKGYGFRDVENNLTVDADTLFNIASTHKSMTALLIANLVDDNTLSWDKPVVSYYPRFKLGSSTATTTVTLPHLLSMSSGIPSETDEVLPDTATPLDVFSTAKQSALLGEPDTNYSYSNISASIAGYIAAFTHKSSDQNLYADYANLLQTKILTPIGMTRSTIYISKARQDANYSKSYSLSDTDQPVLLTSEDIDGDALAPSGSLKSSVNEMALYLSTHLNTGIAPNQNRIVSSENLLKTRQTIINDYAMGWENSTYDDLRITQHTGAYDGYASVLVLIPAENIGLVILTNSEDAAEELTENAYQILIDILNTN